MKRPYLIQRVLVRENNVPSNPTVDQIFRMDYMGSAEFEFGALPSSLKQITKNFDEYVIVKFSIINHEGNYVYALMKKSQSLNEYSDYLNKIIDGSIRLLEYSYLREKKNGEKTYCDVKIWWDLENDIWFTFGKELITKVQDSIKNTREKKIREKAVGWY